MAKRRASRGKHPRERGGGLPVKRVTTTVVTMRGNHRRRGRNASIVPEDLNALRRIIIAHTRHTVNPARSERQRRLFGLALAVRRGEVSGRRVGADARRLARTVPEDLLRAMAHAERYHRRLPNPILQLVGAPARFFTNPRRKRRGGRNGLFGPARYSRTVYRRIRGKLRAVARVTSRANGRRRRRNGLGEFIAQGLGFGFGAAAAGHAVNRVTRRNPPGQRVLGSAIVPFAEARRLVGAKAADAASRGFRRFHGLPALHAIRVRIDDGSSKLTRRAVFEVGEAPSFEYAPRAHSRKHRDGRGNLIVWKHRMGEHGGRKPVAVHDPASGVTSLVGGTFRLGRVPGSKLDWYLN